MKVLLGLVLGAMFVAVIAYGYIISLTTVTAPNVRSEHELAQEGALTKLASEKLELDWQVKPLQAEVEKLKQGNKALEDEKKAYEEENKRLDLLLKQKLKALEASDHELAVLQVRLKEREAYEADLSLLADRSNVPAQKLDLQVAYLRGVFPEKSQSELLALSKLFYALVEYQPTAGKFIPPAQPFTASDFLYGVTLNGLEDIHRVFKEKASAILGPGGYEKLEALWQKPEGVDNRTWRSKNPLSSWGGFVGGGK